MVSGVLVRDLLAPLFLSPRWGRIIMVEGRGGAELLSHGNEEAERWGRAGEKGLLAPRAHSYDLHAVHSTVNSSVD